MSDKVVDLKNVDILRETNAAIHVRMSDGKEEWLPFSQVESIHRSKEPRSSWIVVKEWLAKKKGLV